MIMIVVYQIMFAAGCNVLVVVVVVVRIRVCVQLEQQKQDSLKTITMIDGIAATQCQQHSQQALDSPQPATHPFTSEKPNFITEVAAAKCDGQMGSVDQLTSQSDLVVVSKLKQAESMNEQCSSSSSSKNQAELCSQIPLTSGSMAAKAANQDEQRQLGLQNLHSESDLLTSASSKQVCSNKPNVVVLTTSEESRSNGSMSLTNVNNNASQVEQTAACLDDEHDKCSSTQAAPIAPPRARKQTQMRASQTEKLPDECLQKATSNLMQTTLNEPDDDLSCAVEAGFDVLSSLDQPAKSAINCNQTNQQEPAAATAAVAVAVAAEIRVSETTCNHDEKPIIARQQQLQSHSNLANQQNADKATAVVATTTGLITGLFTKLKGKFKLMLLSR